MSNNPLIKNPALPVVDLRGVPSDEKQGVMAVFEDLAAGAELIGRAGARWVRLTEGTRTKVLEGVPSHWREFLGRLQRVGEGSLHPQLYAVAGRAAQTLGKLPMAEQERYLSERLPVVVEKDGGFDLQRMDVALMSELQRQQVFAKQADGSYLVRSRTAQEVWLKERRAKEATKRLADRQLVVKRPWWTVRGARCFVDPAKVKLGLTRAEVVAILKDMGG